MWLVFRSCYTDAQRVENPKLTYYGNWWLHLNLYVSILSTPLFELHHHSVCIWTACLSVLNEESMAKNEKQPLLSNLLQTNNKKSEILYYEICILWRVHLLRGHLFSSRVVVKTEDGAKGVSVIFTMTIIMVIGEGLSFSLLASRGD